jgi:uncharacterized protein (DUF1800 family)
MLMGDVAASPGTPGEDDTQGSTGAGVRTVDRRAALVVGAGALVAIGAACAPPPAPPPETTTTSTTTAPAPTTTTKAPTTTTTKAPTTTTSTTAPPPPPTGEDEATLLHHARRLTFGPTPEVMARLRAVGTAAWIDEQLDWRAIDESALQPCLANYPRIAQTAAQIDAGPDSWMVVYDMGTAAVVRAVWAKRQLYELLCDFWSNHLNIDINHDPSRSYKPTDDRDVIRTHATGRFADMLVASAKSPAMLTYLDQASSRADGGRLPNENYAREVMELHTVGVGGGYDEADIKEVAYLLTGWSLTSASGGTFTFRSAWHDMGPLASGGDVLGWSPGSLTGQAAGESFLTHLARHPKTANRLAWKMAVRFIGEHVKPTDPVVTTAAQTYLANDTAIAPMARSILTSSEFRASAGRKARRPFEYMAACMRAMRLQFDPLKATNLMWAVNSQLSLLGQYPYSWPAPNGYPDSNAKWLSTGAMVSRWNLASYTAVGFWFGGPTFDITRIIGPTPPATVGEAVDRIGSALLCTPLSSADRAAILSAVGLADSAPWRSWYNQRGLLAYVLQSPANQVR